VVPQIDDNLLTPYIYTSTSAIHRGWFGVPTIKDALPYLGSIDIILVPGLAFTKNGKRLGRGQGYYDTFLAQYPHAKKIGLGFTCQLVDELPVSDHDIVLDEIILS
ncbi:MAG: 5-formyltetrahydrofolate cyclo-ligase, partial [Candidatus Absconditabacterales bacterium]